MRVFLIAPADSTLPGLDAEIAAITSYHDVTALIGTVREVDITDTIAANPEGFECLWWATHASDLGVAITGEVLTSDGVGQFLTATRARLCVLNACASEAIARQIIVGTDADIIYTISDILDSDALRFGTLLSGELAKTDNYREAFNHAAPQRGKYKYLAARAAIRALDQTVSGELQKLAARVDEGVRSYIEMQRSIYQMTVDFKADRLTVVDLYARVVAMQQQFDLLRQSAQTREMRDEIRKEDRNIEMAAMGRKVEAAAQTGSPVVAPPFPLLVNLIIAFTIALAIVALVFWLGGRI